MKNEGLFVHCILASPGADHAPVEALFYKCLDFGGVVALDDLVRDFRDEYQGEYDDEEDFAYEIVEECYDLPEVVMVPVHGAAIPLIALHAAVSTAILMTRCWVVSHFR